MADNVYAKTLESLDLLINYEETLDAVKLDAPADLTPSELRKLYDIADAAQKTVDNSKGDWRTVALDRATDADRLDTMAAEVLALLDARGASAETVKDGRFYVRKLQGKRATAAAVDDPSTPDVDESENSISASQQSNAARIANFFEYLDWLEAQDEYASVSAAGKTVAELRAFAESVAAKHAASITAVTKLSADRNTRDGIYFEDENSILNRAKRVKKLIGGAYGFDSSEYKTANAIPFQRP